MDIGQRNKRVSAYQHKGVWYVGIREWFEAKDGTWRPGSKGISLSMDEWNEFIQKMPQMIEEVKKDTSV